MTFACPAWEFAAEIAATTKPSSPHHWKLSKAHTYSRFAYGFQTSVSPLFSSRKLLGTDHTENTAPLLL
jgi:hypothetical protein